MKKLEVGMRVVVRLDGKPYHGVIVRVITNGYVVRADKKTVISAFDDRTTLLVYAHEIEEEK